MNQHTPVLNRRAFVIGSAALRAASLSVSTSLRRPAVVRAADAPRKSTPGW